MGMDFSFGFPVGAMRLLFGASSWAEMAATLKELVATHGTARAVAEAMNRRLEFAGQGPFRTNETRNAFRFHVDSGIPYYRTVENFCLRRLVADISAAGQQSAILSSQASRRWDTCLRLGKRANAISACGHLRSTRRESI
jgi:hypothetical protein